MRLRSVAWGSVVPLATLLLLALIAAGPLWGPGLLNTRGGGDSPFLLLRTHQLATNLRAGVFPVRWMPDAAYGFGYPFFSYYAALPYYLAAGFTLAGLDILSAIKLTQTLFFAAAALGMYGWARQVLHSRPGGWLAAVAYTLAPFHLVNVYVRGDSLSEFAAFAFYPLILWGLDKTSKPKPRAPSPNAQWVMRGLWPALAYAGLILTHNISALIFSPFVLLYIAMVSCAGDKGQEAESRKPFVICSFAHLSLFIGSLFIGLLLSAWYWLPALTETDYVQLTAQTTGYFFYGNHFRGVDLVQPRLIFDYAITPGGPTPFAMGLVQAALALTGLLVVVVRWARSQRPTRNAQHVSRFMHFATRRETFALAGFLLSTWLITPLSRPLWDHLPLLPMVQFPWRFLSVQALFAALLIGALVAPFHRRGWIAATAVVGLLTVAGLAGLRPEYLPIAAEEVTVERLQLYELFTGNVGSTIRYEYLPRWAVPRPYTGPSLLDPSAPPQAIPLSGKLVCAEEIAHEPTRRVWTVEAGTGGTEVAFPLYYWPGWRATVDGASVEVGPTPDSGYLTLTVPAGRHVVEMWLGRTPLRTVAEGMSLVTALVLLIVITALRRKIPSPKSQTPNRQSVICHFPFVICHLSFVISHLSFVISHLPFVISLALLVAFSPRITVTDDSDLTMDFEGMPYLHHNPGDVDLGGWRMIGYRYNSDRLAPGETLRVTLDWEEVQGGSSATLRMVAPAAVRHDELPAIAAATAHPQARTGSATLELPIPYDVAQGLYLIRLGSGDEEAISVYLRPVWVGEGEMAVEQPVSSTFADGALRLHTAEATQPASNRLDLRLDWSAARPVAANYGLSMRLTDPADNEWARLDDQPGYGFLPTSLWPVGRLIHDRYTLPLPEGTPPGDAYTLTVSLYRVATRESVGEFALPVSLHRATLRADAPVIARFGDELALSRLKAPKRVQQGETVLLTAYWLAVERPSADYVVEWRLEAPGIGDLRFGIWDLAPGSPPTGWPAGALVAGRAALSIPPTTPAGDYILSLTLRDPTSGASLGTYTLPQPVHVQERERVWELPPMQREVGARFGGMIELAGYDLKREGDALHLTLHWRALAVPDQHYMLFVHLADPATGRPIAQVDTMPRGFAYPTGMWAPGEVVSDEVVLSLQGVPAGRYDLVIGWYEPGETSHRLPATDSTGNPLPDDRLILPDGVNIGGR